MSSVKAARHALGGAGFASPASGLAGDTSGAGLGFGNGTRASIIATEPVWPMAKGAQASDAATRPPHMADIAIARIIAVPCHTFAALTTEAADATTARGRGPGADQ